MRDGLCGSRFAPRFSRSSSAAIAQSQPLPVAYTLSLSPPPSSIWSTCRSSCPRVLPQRELQLPVWNALYQVRDFAQYVNWVRAKDRVRQCRSPCANSTRAAGRSRAHRAARLCEYQIYVDSPGPFGAQLNPHHAFLNLAQILMYPVDARSASLSLAFQPYS